MCGLVGIAGNLEFSDEGCMKRLLLLDVLRGADSTGLASVRNTGEIKIAKVPSHPLDLFDMGKFRSVLSGAASVALIGHNRAATKGVINHNNAHPFEVDHIVGAHNGTLEHLSQKALHEALGEEFAVDSQAIIAGIAKLGVEATIKLLRGSYSIVFFDVAKGTLNFIRNKERPMWYTFSEDFKKIFWASEWPMIRCAMDLGGDSYDKPFTDKQGFRYMATSEDILYSFNIDELKAGGKRPKPKTKEIKGHDPFYTVPAPATGGNSNTYDPFHRRQPGENDKGFQPSNVTNLRDRLRAKHRGSTTTSLSVSKPQILELVGTLDSPYAGMIDAEKFRHATKSGCQFCEKPIPYGTSGITVFERDDIVLCRDCSASDPTVTRVYKTAKAMSELIVN